MSANTTNKMNFDQSGHPSNIRWRIFGKFFLLVLVNMIDRASKSIAMPSIAKEFDLSVLTQGLILNGFFWTYALMQIPSGMLADKFGLRKVVLFLR